MHIPDGASALMVWTEHADRASLDSHRAICFGRADITDAAQATGGFVGHGIPMTKSVFFANPAKQVCSKVHAAPQAALKDNPEFAALCHQLADLGYEICPHSAEPANAAPERVYNALEYFARHFASRTWIDHSSRVVHSCMSGQGLNKNSPYYLGDVWRQFGYTYFWQFACEDAAERKIGSINLQQHPVGDWAHTPLFWRHPTETGDFISWATWRGGDLHIYSETALDELSATWGVCINHSYCPAHYDNPARSEYLRQNQDGIFTSTPLLENVLSSLKQRMSTRELIITTINRAITYWKAIDTVEIERMSNGIVHIHNLLNQIITGFTLALRNTNITIPVSVAASTRRVGQDILLTLDFPADASLELAGSPLSLRFLEKRKLTSSDFDKTYGVDTDGTLLLRDLAIDSEHIDLACNYQPTDPQAITDAMLFLGEEPQEFTLVDMGSGKGRIIIGAALLGFKRVIGVEFAHELNETARANLQICDLSQVEIWEGDAADFIFPDDDNLVVYFGNPFKAEMMNTVAMNLKKKEYKKLYIVYRNPKCADELDKYGFLHQLGELDSWKSRSGVKLWRGKHSGVKTLIPASSEKIIPAQEIAVDLMFTETCRQTCIPLFESAQGMVRNGFIGEGVQTAKSHVVASITLKDFDYNGYVAHVRKKGNANAVREARKAAEAGLFSAKFPWYLYIPDIHAINHSAAERGGKPMSANYRRSIEEMGGAPTRPIVLKPPACPYHNKTFFGVFRPLPGHMQGSVQTNQQLLAYVSVNRYGNCAIYTLFLGHYDFLKMHIMNLLHFGTVKSLLEEPSFTGLEYLMYHRYFNNNQGLTFWKKKVAFQPAYWINRGNPVLSNVTDQSPIMKKKQDNFDLRYGVDTAGTIFLRDLTILSPNSVF
jgi:hypothetical protein